MAPTTSLFLGFDASCGECSRIARRITEGSGERVQVMSLRSEAMQEWRRGALGDNPPWAPTLVVEKEGNIQAWTGWQIAPVLSRHLDTRTTWRILAALGGDALSGSPWKGLIQRRALIRGSLGAAVGIGLLARTSSATAMPSTSPRSTTATKSAGVHLEGRDLIAEVERSFASPDMKNVVGAQAIMGLKAKSSDLSSVPKSLLQPAGEGTGSVSTGAEAIEVSGVEHRLSNGVIERTVLCYQHEQRTLLIHTRRTEPVDGFISRAQHMHVDLQESGDLSAFENVAVSVNGHVPVPVPQDADPLKLASDPCGGCNLSCGPGNTCGEKHMTEECDWAATWQCVAGTVSCIGCLSCSGWFYCILCAMASCPAAVDACCSSAHAVCSTCVYPT